MRLLYAATTLFILASAKSAGAIATHNGHPAQFCFTRYGSESVSSISTSTHTIKIPSYTISTYRPGDLITVTPPPTVTTATSLSTATLFETTGIGSTVTVIAAQSTLNVSASSGFLPLANDPSVIVNGGAGGITKKRREVRLHSEPTNSNNRRYPYHHPQKAASPQLVDPSAPSPRNSDIEAKPRRWWFDSWYTTVKPGPAVTCFTHEAIDGVCDPSGIRYVFRADPKRNILSPDMVGNGNRGKGQLDNGARPTLDGKL
ncbi:hypothetical protein BOTNAR_0154g00010 [Botryotinia narcissicola]|uniref:Uncharacterized protein n=1 Tax=Botryotinia narcissicola TaxID=278944 RepID=A0A4Z1IE91_9HELO|nr:hypothetical protein BOTNAR_0154g00010 [Botryotinia narcissicola]